MGLENLSDVNNMKRALLYISVRAQFSELIQVAEMLKQSQKYVPIFFLDTHPFCYEYLDVCRDKKIPCFGKTGQQISLLNDRKQIEFENAYGGNNAKLPKGALKGVMRSYFPRFFRFAKYIYRCFYHNPLFELRKYLLQIKIGRKIINEIKPDILILPGDCIAYETGGLVKAAKERGIPSVVVPFIYNLTPVRDAKDLYNSHYLTLNRPSNYFAAKIYPQWVYEHNGRKIIRSMASEILAMKWLGLAPPRPWVFNSGDTNAIAVESDISFQQYLHDGLPKNQLVLTGSLSQDLLARNINKKKTLIEDLYREFGFSIGLPMLLCAFPANHFKFRGPDWQFCHYEELILFLLKSLAEIKGYNIIVTLHPRTKISEVKHLLPNGNLGIVQKSTASLISLCDIFVADESATIRWAVACGKPVIHFDYYSFRYGHYNKAKGVISVELKDEFVNVLQKLTSDPAFYAEVCSKQAACKDEWGILDGRCHERLLALFDQLIAKYQEVNHVK